MELFSRLFDSAFHSAIKNGDLKKVKQLLDDGTDPNEKQRQRTPLMVAARSANVAAVSVLLDRGVELEAQDRHGNTALMLAAGGWNYNGKDKEEKCLDVVNTLLKSGANPNACGKRGQTALRYALGAGNRRVMELLSEHGATDPCYAGVSTPVPSESH